MTSPIIRMGQVSNEYATRADEYRGIAETAAASESEYKHRRAVFMARQMADGASAAKAEVLADADDAIFALATEYRLAVAVRDAALEKLRQLRTQVEAGRTVVASEREADRIHADGAP